MNEENNCMVILINAGYTRRVPRLGYRKCGTAVSGAFTYYLLFLLVLLENCYKEVYVDLDINKRDATINLF